MSFGIRYKDKSRTDGTTEVYYSVERGDFGAKEEATFFRWPTDARMVFLRLHEDRGISLKALQVVSL